MSEIKEQIVGARGCMIRKRILRFKCVKSIQRKAKRYGATLCLDSLAAGELLVIATPGYVWEINNGPVMIEVAELYGIGSWWSLASVNMNRRMNRGMRKATELEITTIERAEEKQWRADKHEPQRIEIK